MHTLPKRPCSAPGCPELVSGTSRCPKHQKARQRQHDERRGSPSKRGYDAAWRGLRKLKLLADPFCQICTHCADKPLCEHVATEVDHIIPIAERPDLRLEWSNLQSACRACHSAKTMRESVRAG